MNPHRKGASSVPKEVDASSLREVKTIQEDLKMAVTTMKALLEAGVHFGHQTKRWNPKMGKYIYATRNDIHIIDLQISVDHVEAAYQFVKSVVQDGKSVLFVGTKKQAQDAIKQEAERCGMYYINQRWLGGTLTNFKTIRTRIDRLNKINQMELIGEFELLPKKEVSALKKERDDLEKNLGGIKNMRTLPGCLFVVDLKKKRTQSKKLANSISPSLQWLTPTAIPISLITLSPATTTLSAQSNSLLPSSQTQSSKQNKANPSLLLKRTKKSLKLLP